MQEFSIKTLGYNLGSPTPELNADLGLDIKRKQLALSKNAHQRALQLKILEKQAKILIKSPAAPIIVPGAQENIIDLYSTENLKQASKNIIDSGNEIGIKPQLRYRMNKSPEPNREAYAKFELPPLMNRADYKTQETNKISEIPPIKVLVA